jgi:hypothetical protein
VNDDYSLEFAMPLIGALQHVAHYIQVKKAVNTFLLHCSKNTYLLLIYLKTTVCLFSGDPVLRHERLANSAE